MVKVLIEKGAGVNLRHKQGGSALMEGAAAGNVSVIEILLRAGADPMREDEDGVTALMSAASQGHTDVARWDNTSQHTTSPCLPSVPKLHCKFNFF